MTDPFNNFENERQQLLRYNDLKGKITYNKSSKFGRVYSKNGLGLQSLRREIRHTLSSDYYIDIDIVNCHPEILNQVFIMNNSKYKYLHAYCKQRDKIIKQVMDIYNVNRDTVKNLFLRLLYGCNYNCWAKKIT